MTKKRLTKPDSIFFDMDGTLWNGVEAYAQGFNDFFKVNKISKRFTKEELYKYMGMEENRYLEVTLPEFSANKRTEIYKKVIEFQYKRIEKSGGELYAGVQEGLAVLAKNYKLFIVSNCPEFTIRYFTAWAKIEQYITDSMSHGMNYKPKHENIKHLIDKYKLKRCVYIGDTESDAKQSRLAGVPFGFVSYGFGTSKKYDFRFNSFKELTKYFDSIV